MDIVGSNVGERMRVLFLRAVLYMEVAWFDQDANASRILTAHLATAAPAVRGAIGDILAASVQIGVALAVGLSMALAVNWKMTLVITAALLLLGFAVYVKEVCTGVAPGCGGVPSDGLDCGLRGSLCVPRPIAAGHSRQGSLSHIPLSDGRSDLTAVLTAPLTPAQQTARGSRSASTHACTRVVSAVRQASNAPGG